MMEIYFPNITIFFPETFPNVLLFQSTDKLSYLPVVIIQLHTYTQKYVENQIYFEICK